MAPSCGGAFDAHRIIYQNSHLRSTAGAIINWLIAPWSAVAIHLDRRYIAHPRLALDLRLIALSFAIVALGKCRARRLLIRDRGLR
jgi:hypothetical protein